MEIKMSYKLEEMESNIKALNEKIEKADDLINTLLTIKADIYQSKEEFLETNNYLKDLIEKQKSSNKESKEMFLEFKEKINETLISNNESQEMLLEQLKTEINNVYKQSKDNQIELKKRLNEMILSNKRKHKFLVSFSVVTIIIGLILLALMI